MRIILFLNVVVLILRVFYANYGALVAYQQGFRDGKMWELSNVL